MKITISDKFTVKKILLFSLPCIGMQLVDNTYQVVDGYFISNFLGESVFAAENMIFPPLALIMSLGLVMGAGGSAIISAYLGEGKEDRARQTLSMLSVFLFIGGIIISALAFLFMPNIAKMAGAPESLVPYCTVYGRILSSLMPVQMMNYAFQEYLIAADQGKLGFISSVVNAVTNIVLDFAFVGFFGWGLWGAALATGLAWCVSCVVAFSYFVNKKHRLHFMRFKIHMGDTLLALGNGSSEMVDAVSYVIVAIIFNRRLIALLGERGVASYAVTEYMTGVFAAIFMGIGIAMIPVIGFRYGEKNFEELKKLRNDGLKLAAISGTIMMCLALLLSGVVARIFVGYDLELKAMATLALRVCAFAYALSGINMFSSSFFTGISDGLASAVIAAMRSFAMPLIFVFLLPYLFGHDGIWFTTLAAEVVGVCVVIVLYRLRFTKGLKWGREEE